MPNPSKPADPYNALDPFLSKKQICSDLGIHPTTLWSWIRAGRFPQPTILNPGQAREIPAWPTSVYLAHKATLPVRMAKPITEAAYEKRRRKRSVVAGNNVDTNVGINVAKSDRAEPIDPPHHIECIPLDPHIEALKHELERGKTADWQTIATRIRGACGVTGNTTGYSTRNIRRLAVDWGFYKPRR